MRRRSGFGLLLSLPSLALALLAPPAGAEEGDPSAGTEGSDLLDLSLEALTEVDVITITARKREESMQQTPVTLTAFSGKSLRDRGVERLDELAKFVPNLTFDDGSLRGASIYIRGVGQRDTRQFLEPGVGVYVDGVYVSRQSALLPLIDVERIEVLRGPQGTLYGRNTIGGAINYVSKKPGPDPELRAELDVGNYSMVQSRASVNLPIVDERLYSRFTMATRTRDGYTNNLVDGSNWDDDSLLAGGAAFRLLPFDFLTVDLKGHYTRQNMHQRAGKCFVSDPTNSTAQGLLAANGLFGASNPDVHAACRVAQNADFYDFTASTSGLYRLETWGASGTLDFDFDPVWILEDLGVKSITAWNVQSEWDKQNDVDSSGAVLIDRTFYAPQDITNFSQELTVTAYTTLGEALPFLPEPVAKGGLYATIGGFANWEKSREGVQDNLAVGGGGPLIVPVPNPFGPGFVPFDITQSSNPTLFAQPEIDNESYAFYTQWTAETWDYLHLTGGVRYTWEEKGLSRFEPLATGSRSQSFDQVTPMATLKLLAPSAWLEPFASESGILYYTYAEGFKSGGFNEVTDPSVPDTPANQGERILPDFQEETLRSHELGLKLDLWNSRALFNAAFFYNEYDDMQLTVVRVDAATGEVGASIVNAGQATVKGFELELTTAPVRGLQINASVGFIDAGFDEFLDVDPQDPMGPPVDRSDEPFFDVPDVNANVGVQYTLVLGDFGPAWLGRLTPRYDYSYKSERAFHLTRTGFESGLFDQGKVHLHALRLTWESRDLRYKAGFWMENVSGEEYINGAIDLSDFFGTGATRVGAPRTWGFEVGYHWL